VPVQEMFKGRLHIIRPLFLTEKRLIRSLVKKMQWRVVKNPCPFAENTKRKFVEKFVEEKIYPLGYKVRKSIITALFNVKPQYLPPKPKKS